MMLLNKMLIQICFKLMGKILVNNNLNQHCLSYMYTQIC